jgi:hypothetical protein
MLLVPLLADFLGHSNPQVWGWVVALLSMPAVLIADALVKRWAAATRPRS